MESDSLSIPSHVYAMVDSSESSFNNQLIPTDNELQSQQPLAESSPRGSRLRISVASPPDRNDIAMLLECPVCYEIMLPPIFSCAKGHNVCFECRRQVRICPVCRDDYDGSYRNLLAEQLACKSRILCKYNNAGCNLITCGNELKDHQDFCSYRALACPDCDAMVVYDQFLQHIRDHEVGRVEGSEFSTGYEIHEMDFSSAPQKWELTWLYCFDSNFLCHTEKHDHCWCFWISCADINESIKDYLCEIVLWNKEKGMEIRYKGPVNPLRTNAQDVVSSGSGLTLPKNSIRAAVYRGGIDVVFRIEEAQYQYPAPAMTLTESLVNASIFVPELELGLGTSSEPDAHSRPASPVSSVNLDLVNLVPMPPPMPPFTESELPVRRQLLRNTEISAAGSGSQDLSFGHVHERQQPLASSRRNLIDEALYMNGNGDASSSSFPTLTNPNLIHLPLQLPPELEPEVVVNGPLDQQAYSHERRPGRYTGHLGRNGRGMGRGRGTGRGRGYTRQLDPGPYPDGYSAS